MKLKSIRRRTPVCRGRPSPKCTSRPPSAAPPPVPRRRGARWRRRRGGGRGGAARAARASGRREIAQTVRPGTPPASAVRRQSPAARSRPAPPGLAIASRSSVASAFLLHCCGWSVGRGRRHASGPGSPPARPAAASAAAGAGDAGHRWRWASPSEGFMIFAGKRKGRAAVRRRRPKALAAPARRADVRGRGGGQRASAGTRACTRQRR